MNELTDIAVIVLAAGFVAVVAVVTAVTWRVVRRFTKWRSRLDRVVPGGVRVPSPEALAAAWARTQRTSLTARAVVGTGTRRQALWMRRDLRSHVDAADTAVRVARAADAPVGDLPYLVGHLRDQARRHDHALVLVSKGVSAMDLPEARAETARITSQADKVSSAVVDALRCGGALGPDQLALALDHETRAVSEGSARLRSLTTR